jgi:uncharacterized protein YjiS (DUF1127 family)
MNGIIARSFATFGVGSLGAETVNPGTRPSLLERYGAWLQRRQDAARLREMDPRSAADIGAAPGADRAPAGFAVDPRPLWRLGLAPMPMDTLPSAGPRRR